VNRASRYLLQSSHRALGKPDVSILSRLTATPLDRSRCISNSQTFFGDWKRRALKQKKVWWFETKKYLAIQNAACRPPMKRNKLSKWGKTALFSIQDFTLGPRPLRTAESIHQQQPHSFLCPGPDTGTASIRSQNPTGPEKKKKKKKKKKPAQTASISTVTWGPQWQVLRFGNLSTPVRTYTNLRTSQAPTSTSRYMFNRCKRHPTFSGSAFGQTLIRHVYYERRNQGQLVGGFTFTDPSTQPAPWECTITLLRGPSFLFRGMPGYSHYYRQHGVHRTTDIGDVTSSKHQTALPPAARSRRGAG